MQGILYENAWYHFVIVTLILGGAAAWMTGRASATTWSSPGILLWYLVLLAAAVRFLHKAPLGGTLLSPHYYLVDLAVVLIFGFLGYFVTRTRQMTTRYGWLFVANGPLGWKRR